MSLADRWRALLHHLHALGRQRALAAAAGIDFSSNDYLGFGKLAPPPVVPDSWSGQASRLLRGHHALWDDVEARLACWHDAEAALVFGSGYVANEGLLSTILGPDDLVFSDQLNHASIIDGLRLTKAERVVFRHNDLDDLESKLKVAKAPRGERFLVTESLFGMEGDVAPLPAIAALAQQHGVHVVVDEAHATGCFGPDGSGLVDSLGLRPHVLASVHTGGKALGVPGAYVVGSRLLKDVLVNRCRHFIFTTALPPQIARWWLHVLDRAASADETRRRLHANAARLREALRAAGVPTGGEHYIVPIVLGADADATAWARHLQAAGFDVRAIRPPTVPEGTARLRISVHADHDDDSLAGLASALASLSAAAAR
jgi:8-amino-7-oxononanoate synthase